MAIATTAVKFTLTQVAKRLAAEAPGTAHTGLLGQGDCMKLIAEMW